jgi:hypothetical protein
MTSFSHIKIEYECQFKMSFVIEFSDVVNLYPPFYPSHFFLKKARLLFSQKGGKGIQTVRNRILITSIGHKIELKCQYKKDVFPQGISDVVDPCLQLLGIYNFSFFPKPGLTVQDLFKLPVMYFSEILKVNAFRNRLNHSHQPIICVYFLRNEDVSLGAFLKNERIHQSKPINHPEDTCI